MYNAEFITDKARWEEFVLSQAPQSFLHSWNWGETQRRLGKQVQRLGFLRENRLAGVCLIIKDLARRGPHYIIPGGPLIDWTNSELVGAVLKELKASAAKDKVWFIRMRPELADTGENRKLFASLGFIPAPMHLHAENTWVLDVQESDDRLLAEMRKTTRYLIRKSLKLGLQFEEGHSPAEIDILVNLQDATVERHNFVGFSRQYFAAQLEAFGKDGQAALYICCENTDPLVAALIIFYGDYAYYHHSGSTPRATEIPASYFMQWQIIQEAKRRGCKHYNFWGIAPAAAKTHRFAGVTLFKKGFGGKAIDWLHAHDLPLSPLYYATYAFETGRRIMRGL